MQDKNYEFWDVYHLIHPYFFPHYHFYKRKVIALKKSGLNASLLTFVNSGMYESNISKYSEAENSDIIKVIKIKSSYFLHFALLLFVFKELLKGRNLLFHVLKFNANSLFLIKFIPFLNKRIKIIYEFEGDSSSEFIYNKESFDGSERVRSSVKIQDKIKYSLKLLLDTIKVRFSDALVLMSQEHVDLWENRIDKEIKSFIFPTFPEKKRVYYSFTAREEIRSNLKLKNKTVLIYVGNVVCKWQRLDDMCKFVCELESRLSNIVFLLLVREEDFFIAKKAISKYKIEEFTILKSVLSDDVCKYMSAADIAIFLRHDHIMNNIVTSGKLGEYLATGLPIISTGANASVLNKYMENKNIIIKITDDLEIKHDFVSYLNENVNNMQLATDRSFLGESFHSLFDIDLILNKNYPELIKEVINEY